MAAITAVCLFVWNLSTQMEPVSLLFAHLITSAKEVMFCRHVHLLIGWFVKFLKIVPSIPELWCWKVVREALFANFYDVTLKSTFDLSYIARDQIIILAW